MGENNLPDYRKPPVIEVVSGIAFEKLDKFKGPHIGLFWQRLRDEFPYCEHAVPLDLTDFRELPLPRMWFLNKEKNGLIQLQNNRFVYNWRKIRDDENYPRYREVIRAFKQNLDIFRVFLNEEGFEPLKLTNCELSYINHIPKGTGWDSFSKIHNTLPDLCWRSDLKRFLPDPNGLGWNLQFPLPNNNGNLNVDLKHAYRKKDSLPMLIFEISAQGLNSNKSLDAIWDWFEIAHEWIVRGFADLTSLDVQKEFW